MAEFENQMDFLKEKINQKNFKHILKQERMLSPNSHLPPGYFGVNSGQHATDDLKGKFL